MGQLGSQDISNHPHWIVLSTRLLTNAERPAHIHKTNPQHAFLHWKKICTNTLHSISSRYQKHCRLFSAHKVFTWQILSCRPAVPSSWQKSCSSLTHSAGPTQTWACRKPTQAEEKSHKYYKTHQVPTHTHNTVRTAACNFSWCDFWERYFLLLHVLFSRFVWNYLQHYLQIFHIFFLSFYQLMDVTLPLLLLRAQWIQAVQVRTPCKTGATPRGEVCMKKKTNQPTSPSTSTKPTNDCLYR